MSTRQLMSTLRLVDTSANTGECNAPRTVLGGVMTPSPIRNPVDIMAMVMTMVDRLRTDAVVVGGGGGVVVVEVVVVVVVLLV